MVAINKTTARTAADAVCPDCFKLLPNPKVMPETKDSYGRILRRYFGFCLECNVGFEVIQFLRRETGDGRQETGGRWIIHKYQAYYFVGTETKHQKLGEWVALNELPDPAPIILGPGGDFRQPVKLNCFCISPEDLQKEINEFAKIDQQVELLCTLQKILESLTKTIGCMVKAFKGE